MFRINMFKRNKFPINMIVINLSTRPSFGGGERGGGRGGGREKRRRGRGKEKGKEGLTQIHSLACAQHPNSGNTRPVFSVHFVGTFRHRKIFTECRGQVYVKNPPG